MEKKKILLATPLKNEAFWILKHLKAWEKVDYPRDRIRWIILLGRSIDKTEEILLKYFKTHKWNVEIYPESKFYNPLGNALFIADVLNEFKKYYKDEDFVIVEDGDIRRIPKNFLIEMIKLDLDIVAPSVWIDKTKPPQFFDTYVFRTLDGKEFPFYEIPYEKSKLPIELQSAGTILVIKGEVFQKVQFENPIPNLQFCRNARKMGYKVWFAPWMKVLHANVLKEKREAHFPLEFYVEQGKIPKEMLEKVK